MRVYSLMPAWVSGAVGSDPPNYTRAVIRIGAYLWPDS